MKKIKLIVSYILILFVMISTVKVSADSGFDANYNSSSTGEIVSSISSAASPAIEIIGSQPGDESYETAHIIISVICILLFYVFTCIYIYRLFNNYM